MTFKGGANVYFELEPFDTISETDDDSIRLQSHVTQIVGKKLLDDDEWVEEMFVQDADQFLSSINKNRGNVSVVSSRKISSVIGEVEDRNDRGSRNKHHESRNSPVKMNRNFRSSTDQWDDNDTNLARMGIVGMNHEHENPSSFLSTPTPGSKDYVSSTESSESRTSASRNKYYVSSTESSDSRNSATRNGYIKSTESNGSMSIGRTEIQRIRQQSGLDSPTLEIGSLVPTLLVTQSILNDRNDTKAKIEVPPLSVTQSILDDLDDVRETIGIPPLPATPSILDDVDDMQQDIEVPPLSLTQSILDDLDDVQATIEVPPLSVTQSILDDLDDMQAKIDTSHVEGTSACPEEPLWELLWGRRWSWAQQRVRLHPEEAREKYVLPIISSEHSNGEEPQTSEESDDIHSALPLHLACAVRPLPPTALVRDLINAYPAACQKCQKSSGFLPIHMAANLRPIVHSRETNAESSVDGAKQFSSSSEENEKFDANNTSVQQCKEDSENHGDIINLLLNSYPGSITVRESINSMTPLHIAASTTRAENGIVSPVVSNVLNILLAKSPANFMKFCNDKNGMTPYDWAWRNVDYFCPRCGLETTTNSFDETKLLLSTKTSDALFDYDAALLKLDAGMRCKCTQSFSVSETSLHPFLQKDICSHLEASVEQSAAMSSPKIAQSSPSTTNYPQPSPRKDIGDDEDRKTVIQKIEAQCNIISDRELDKIRQYANLNLASRRKTCKNGESGESAMLHMKIRLSELVHPSLHSKRRTLGVNVKNGCVRPTINSKSWSAPSPYFELFAAHRRGMSRSYYKSYPLRGSTEGTWEEAFLDLGLTRKQLENGTNGAGYIEIGIRVMHLPDKGSDIKCIGSCQISLEALERQQQERMRLQDEVCNLKHIIGDDREVAMALPEPKMYPILKGFEVTGKLQVLSLSIK